MFRRTRVVVLASVALVLVAGAVALGRPNRVAAAVVGPHEIAVIPPDLSPVTQSDGLLFTGEQGFAHRPPSSSTAAWTRYSDGKSMQVPGLISGTVYGTAGDIGWVHNGGAWQRYDFDGMSSTTITPPANTTFKGEFGNSVLATTVSGTAKTTEILDYAANGTATARPVTVPDSGSVLSGYAGDSGSEIVGWVSADGLVHGYGLFDLATTTVYPINALGSNPCRFAVSSASIVIYSCGTSSLDVYPRTGILAGTSTAPSVVAAPAPTTFYRLAVVGDTALMGTDQGQTISSEPLAGGGVTKIMSSIGSAAIGLMQAPDGSAIAIGGTGATDWAVRRLTPASAGIVDTVVLPLDVTSNAGVQVSQGVVHHVEVASVAGLSPTYTIFNRVIDPSAGAHVAGINGINGPLNTPRTCVPDVECVREVAGNNSADYYLQASGSGESLREQLGSGYSAINLGSVHATIADISPTFLLVNGYNPDHQYVVRADGYAQTSTVGAPGAASLWFDRLWRQGPTTYEQGGSIPQGHLQWWDVTIAPTGSTRPQLHLVQIPSACRLADLQATQRWIYWSCGGAGMSGVIDLKTGASIKVPSGPALVGDGYLVQHDRATGDLLMYDFHTDTVAAPVAVANVPWGAVSDDRRIAWSVDRYSGGIAYADANNSVHVIDPGVPTTPPTAATSRISAQFLDYGQAPYSIYTAFVETSAPIASATFQVRRRNGGALVYTQTDGPSTSGAVLSWDGKLADGTAAYSGDYVSSLSITPVGQTTPIPLAIPGSAKDPFYLYCGRSPFNSYDCLGDPAILAVRSDGESGWFYVSMNGTLINNGYTDYWPLGTSSSQVSTVVRFGDFNGDGLNDVLARSGTGVLTAYFGYGNVGTGGIASPYRTPKTIGSGWNAYNAFASPGDLTGDGIADLVARDTTGKVWLFAGTGKSSFKTRVALASNWSGYTKLIGVGDLNGDGHDDLLAIDKSGVLWRYNGLGTGKLAVRVQVSTGWSGYNAVLGVGDWNLDAKNDLLARDTAGTLWLFRGNGSGGFAVRSKISTGWQTWKQLF